MRRLRRVFPGWWVLAGSFSINALFSATTSYGTALFLVPLTLEFGWSRMGVSTALALARLESGIAGPAEGVMVDRWGSRRVMLIGLPLAGLGYYLWAHIGDLSALTGMDVLLLFYLVYVGLVALGGAFASNVAASTAVARWFRRRRGLALGILSSGHGLGAAIWVPILGLIIQEEGWRSAVIFQGIVIVALGIPAALLVRRSPEQYGLRPDGDPPEVDVAVRRPDAGAGGGGTRALDPGGASLSGPPGIAGAGSGHAAGGAADAHPVEGTGGPPATPGSQTPEAADEGPERGSGPPGSQGSTAGGDVPAREPHGRGHGRAVSPVPGSREEPAYTIGEAMRTSAFWCLAFAFAFRVMVTNAVQVHIAALLQDIGMSPLASAGVLSAISALSIIGRFGMGWIGDLFERRRVYLVALVMMIAGLLVLSAAREPWMVIPFLALYAPAYGGLAALAGALRGDYFGVRAFGTISGAMGPITTLGTIIGPLFAGYVFDTTGSYQIAMITFAFCGLISLGLMFLARRPATAQ